MPPLSVVTLVPFHVAPVWLRPGGAVVVEMGETQTERAVALARSLGFVEIGTIIDLTGRPRGITARRPQ